MSGTRLHKTFNPFSAYFYTQKKSIVHAWVAVEKRPRPTPKSKLFGFASFLFHSELR
jgi:hypothetical protein